MGTPAFSARVWRFGPFEIDERSQQLRREGLPVKLQEQPTRILLLLLEYRGETVSREQLHRHLWPSDTFVDFDHSLNTAVMKLREALGDSPDKPLYLETLPRKGYRFIAPVSTSPVLRKPDPSSTPEPVAESSSVEAITVLAAPPSPEPDTSSNFEFHLSIRKSYAGAIGAATAVFIALAIGAFYYSVASARESAAVPEVMPFTWYPGMEVQPAFSPEGTRIAFGWNGEDGARSKGMELYMKVIGGEQLLRLTHHPSVHLSPAWSPDGAQMAFHRLAEGDTGLYLVPSLGGVERKLRSTHLVYPFAAQISWSPDGKLIAFSDTDATSNHLRLYLISPESMQIRQVDLPERCEHQMQPAFSRDGKWLAYLCGFTSGLEALFIVSPSGGKSTQIASIEGFIEGIAWTHNSKSLIFSNDSGGGAQLFEIPLANGKVRKLPFGDAALWPAISPAGDRAAYGLFSRNINIWRQDLSKADGLPVKLISSTREQASPQFSPDGRHIVFESTRSGWREIWMIDADGSNPVQLTSLKTATGSPQWSPNGRKVVFTSRFAGLADIFVVDIDERVPRKLITDMTDIFFPNWSRDGRWIYFTTERLGQHKLYRCPSTGGNALDLGASSSQTARESLDGQTLFFVSDVNGEFKSLDLAHGGMESSVAGMPKVRYSDWTVAKNGIYFAPEKAAGSVDFFNLANHRITHVTNINGSRRLSGLSISSDGLSLLYTEVDELTSDIMLVEHFH